MWTLTGLPGSTQPPHSHGPEGKPFIATDKATDHAPRSMLTEQEPPVSTVMRDLGIDHQAARRRRIPVLRQRFQKATQRKIKLRSLKTPALKIRRRLHKGGIQPVALWGVEAQGAPLQNCPEASNGHSSWPSQRRTPGQHL